MPRARKTGTPPEMAAPYGEEPTPPVGKRAKSPAELYAMYKDDADRALIAQFATGLLRDGTGSYDADDVALRNRVKDAFNRARVMLEEFKKFEV